MRSTVLLASLATLAVASCGSPQPPRHPSTSTTVCSVPAHAGCSVPKQSRTLTIPPTSSRIFPDISEYQACPSFYGPVIFKVYEGGYGQDHSARCNATRVHANGTWAGVYAFLRPQNCAGQGYATAQIVRQLGGVPGPVVADAEVWLPPGCVQAFLSQVRVQLGGPTDVYTSPGTWPGGSLPAPLWVATYGSRPGCVADVCSHVAWQFSDSYRCHGVTGDCSIDSGILSQTRQPKPRPRPNPWPRVAYLRGLAKKHGCYKHTGRKPHACAVWALEVRHLIHGY